MVRVRILTTPELISKEPHNKWMPVNPPPPLFPAPNFFVFRDGMVLTFDFLLFQPQIQIRIFIVGSSDS